MEIEINQLQVNASIGVYAHEKTKRQPLIITLKLSTTPPKADQIAEAIDYTAIATLIETTAEQQHYELIETLAMTLMQALTQQFGNKQFHLNIQKPHAIAKAKHVSVSLTQGEL